jgi:hypothetical protein
VKSTRRSTTAHIARPTASAIIEKVSSQADPEVLLFLYMNEGFDCCQCGLGIPFIRRSAHDNYVDSKMLSTILEPKVNIEFPKMLEHFCDALEVSYSSFAVEGVV